MTEIDCELFDKAVNHHQARIQGVGAGAGAHPWDGDSPYHSIAFKHQFITGRPPLGEILYPPLTTVRRTLGLPEVISRK